MKDVQNTTPPSECSHRDISVLGHSPRDSESTRRRLSFNGYKQPRLPHNDLAWLRRQNTPKLVNEKYDRTFEDFHVESDVIDQGNVLFEDEDSNEKGLDDCLDGSDSLSNVIKDVSELEERIHNLNIRLRDQKASDASRQHRLEKVRVRQRNEATQKLATCIRSIHSASFDLHTTLSRASHRGLFSESFEASSANVLSSVERFLAIAQQEFQE